MDELPIIDINSGSVTAEERAELMNFCQWMKRTNIYNNCAITVVDHSQKKIVYRTSGDGLYLTEEEQIRSHFESITRYIPEST